MSAALPLVFASEGQGRRTLRALYPLISADAPTTWIHVAMEGEWRGHPSGPFVFTRETFAQVVANFEANPNPIPLEYEHPEYGQPAPASGWVQKIEARADGLYALVELTDEAAQWIKEGRYRYSSGVFVFNSVDPVTGESIGVELAALGLTNVPFIRGQHPIRLSRRAAPEGVIAMTFSKEALLAAIDFLEKDQFTVQELEAAMHAAAAKDGALADGEGGGEPAVEPAPEEKPAEEASAAAEPAAEPEKKDEEEEEQKSAASLPLSAHELAAREIVITALRDRNTKLEVELRGYREREADDAINALISGGRLLDNARAQMRSLYLSHRETYDAVAASLPQTVPVGRHASAMEHVSATAIPEDDPQVVNLRKQLSAARLPREKQDETIRKALAARNSARV